jgi:hypothetical protein
MVYFMDHPKITWVVQQDTPVSGKLQMIKTTESRSFGEIAEARLKQQLQQLISSRPIVVPKVGDPRDPCGAAINKKAPYHWS